MNNNAGKFHFGQIIGVGKVRDRICRQDTKMERLLTNLCCELMRINAVALE
jgi:hypothetical protein